MLNIIRAMPAGTRLMSPRSRRKLNVKATTCVLGRMFANKKDLLDNNGTRIRVARVVNETFETYGHLAEVTITSCDSEKAGASTHENISDSMDNIMLEKVSRDYMAVRNDETTLVPHLVDNDGDKWELISSGIPVRSNSSSQLVTTPSTPRPPVRKSKSY